MTNKEFDELIQEMAKCGKVINATASRREIAKLRDAFGQRKPQHPIVMARLLQPKQEPKRTVRNLRHATPMPMGKRTAGEKIEPWNK